MKTFVVIGLGRFGSAVATELCSLGHEVLAIDADSERVQKMAEQVTHAVAGDAKDPAVLRALGVRNFDCAIVAAGSDVGDSALITLNLKELGLPRIICKARNHSHREVLRRIGADQVVFPELESGRNLARTLANREILNYIELTERYGIVKLKVPARWVGKTLRDLNVRANYQVNIIAIQSGDEAIQPVPSPDYPFRAGDLIFTLGDNESNERILALE